MNIIGKMSIFLAIQVVFAHTIMAKKSNFAIFDALIGKKIDQSVDQDLYCPWKGKMGKT